MAGRYPLQPLLPADPLKNQAEPAPLAALAQSLGHTFRDPELLVQAATHAAASHGRGDAIDNERLEFLGDRVLGLVIAQLLMERFPKAKEGDLGPRLTALVRREALAEVAGAIDLGSYLVLAPADAASGARNHPKFLADACEAVIAALYLDGGLDAARRFIANGWAGQIGAVSVMPIEPKTALQEWAQGHGRPLPLYTVTKSAGAAHGPIFEVKVEVQGLEPALASGPSKRAAEKAAALTLLQRLGVVPAEP
jgi:ribonuclease-3